VNIVMTTNIVTLCKWFPNYLWWKMIIKMTYTFTINKIQFLDVKYVNDNVIYYMVILYYTEQYLLYSKILVKRKTVKKVFKK